MAQGRIVPLLCMQPPHVAGVNLGKVNMNTYDQHQLTARELDRPDPCPSWAVCLMSACMTVAGVCVAVIVAFAW